METFVCSRCGGYGDQFENRGSVDAPDYQLQSCPMCRGLGHCPSGGFSQPSSFPKTPRKKLLSKMEQAIRQHEIRVKQFLNLPAAERQLLVEKIKAKHRAWKERE